MPQTLVAPPEMAQPQPPQSEPRCELETSFSPVIPNVIFIVSAICLFFITSHTGMDDPGLGWHLRYADRMWETGDFLRVEEFSAPNLGIPLVSSYWLGDVALRLCHAWGGMNGIGVLTALTFALMGRILLVRMIREQVPWLLALAATLYAIVAVTPGFLARPNMFTFVGLAITVTICERFHSGAISRRQTLWLLPVFLIWTNTHGGFLSGVMVLVITYFCECLLSVTGTSESRKASRGRAVWLTGLGCALFLTTLLNPDGYGLYLHLFEMLGGESIQRTSTTEWFPPDFTGDDWFMLEALIVALPILAVASRRKPSLVAIAICIVFLHYAITVRRFTTIWPIIAVPTLVGMMCGLPWFMSLKKRLVQTVSSDFLAKFANSPRLASPIPSIVFAMLLLVVSPWLPPISAHNRESVPTAALDKLLEIQHGERVFHEANWGGYLTWHGWDLSPRFLTWIDDRTDIYGAEHYADYKSIINAGAGWEDKLDGHRIEILCLPVNVLLVGHVRRDARWKEVYSDRLAVIFRRVEPLVAE